MEYDRCYWCGRRSERASLGLSCYHCGRKPRNMEDVMKKVLIMTLSITMGILTGLWTADAFAQSVATFGSGVFYDEDRNGEGIIIFQDDTRMVGYLFTYGEHDCHLVSPPMVSPVPIDGPHCDLYQGQRWFFFADNHDKGYAEGVLYVTEGVNYPEGELNPKNPFGVNVGAAVKFGEYYIRPAGEGYQFIVEGEGDDPLFNRVFEFTTVLFAK